MPISRKRQIAFVHIPKTGGQTIEKVFGFGTNEHDLFGVKNTVELSHLSALEIRNRIKTDGYYFFSFVRNPWDRLVSEYFYRQRFNNFKLIGWKKDGRPTFEEFVYLVNNLNRNLPHYVSNHFRTQSSFIYDKNGLQVDFVGRFETFQRDVETLMRKFHIHGKVPHVNKTNHDHYRTYYNPETRKIVAQLYKSDIRNFRYKF